MAHQNVARAVCSHTQSTKSSRFGSTNTVCGTPLITHQNAARARKSSRKVRACLCYLGCVCLVLLRFDALMPADCVSVSKDFAAFRCFDDACRLCKCIQRFCCIMLL
jgi:hypothetical protein